MNNNLEIERKYLITDFPREEAKQVSYIHQAYLMVGEGKTLRIRNDVMLDSKPFLSAHNEQQESKQFILQHTINSVYTLCYKSGVSAITRKEFERLKKKFKEN